MEKSPKNVNFEKNIFFNGFKVSFNRDGFYEVINSNVFNKSGQHDKPANPGHPGSDKKL